ncbi:hypothetical protein vseg_013940 [Gypsophila vaccaria]
MCGRCRCTLRPADLARVFHLPDTAVHHVDVDRYRPMYNVSPGSYLPVLRRGNGGDEGYTATVHCMKWGLIPSFTKKDEKPDHYRMFNARSESIGEKASFRRLIPNNRCLVAVEGFYEWKKGTKRQPYYIHLKDGRPLVFAALYDSWKNAEGELLYTFTILTCESSSTLQWLHDRMPIILGDEVSTDMWLNGPSDTKLNAVLKPYEESDLAWYPVSSAMNKASFDGPECIKEIVLKEQQVNPITKFFSKRTGDEKESSNIAKSLAKESTVTDVKDITKESEAHSDVKLFSSAAESDSETKFVISTHIPRSEIKAEGKRDYEEFIADSKPKANPAYITPHKSVKKSKVKGGAEKQATLRSYFGKS